MGHIFASIGIVTIIILIFVIIKKTDNYFYSKSSEGLGWNSMYIADEKVFKAARTFAQGASNEEIKEILLCCIDFDDEDAEEILTCSQKHKADDDGGYSYFLKAVNKVLGENVYCDECS